MKRALRRIMGRSGKRNTGNSPSVPRSTRNPFILNNPHSDMKLNGTLEIFDWSRDWQILFWKQKWAYCDQQYMKLKMSAPSTAAIVLSSGLIKEPISNINAGITLWGGVSEVVTLFDFLSKNTVNFKLNSRLVDCYQWLSCTNEISHVGDDEALIFNVAIWHKWSFIPERNLTRDNATKILE